MAPNQVSMMTKEERTGAVKVAIREMGRGLWRWGQLEDVIRLRHGAAGFSSPTLQRMAELFAEYQGGGEWRTKDSTFGP